MAAHAKRFGASNAHRWLNCLAAPAREEGLPSASSADARQGTAAHFLAAECLQNGLTVAQHLGKVIVVWEHAPSNSKGECFEEDFHGGQLTGIVVDRITVDDELVEHVTAYVEFVRHLVDTIPGAQLFVEVRVDYRQWLPEGIDSDDGFGTSDVIIVTPDELITVDLKFGAGNKVDAENNPQLQLYTLGAYAEHSLLNDFKQARMMIHQPRKGGVSEWVQSIDELLAFGEYVKGRAQLICDSTEIVGTPGKKTCLWCKVKSSCPDLQADVLATVFGDFEDLTAAEPRLVPSVELATVWEKRDMIRGFLSAVEERMLEETRAGNQPNYKIVEGRKGARAWVDADEAEKVLKGMRLKREEMYSYKLISPTAAEKLLKERPRAWNSVKVLINQPSGGDAIAPISDPRPAKPAVKDDFLDEDLF